MNKILAVGLIMAVASTATYAGQGGFGVGIRAGVAFVKVKGTRIKTVPSTGNAQDKPLDVGAKPKKTMGQVDLVLDYFCCLADDWVCGVALEFGTMLGKARGKFKQAGVKLAGKGTASYGAGADDSAVGETTVKQTWHAALVASVGYRITPEDTISLGFGGTYANYKVSTVTKLADKDATKQEGFAVIGNKKRRFSPLVQLQYRHDFGGFYLDGVFRYSFAAKLPSKKVVAPGTSNPPKNGDLAANGGKWQAFSLHVGVGKTF
ncbi:MAG: hypothetical protein LBT03_01360 [Holosporales bacterium]|jgi:hypothetical protein|nr:hypothetical protein [Holosporales bacterium]